MTSARPPAKRRDYFPYNTGILRIRRFQFIISIIVFLLTHLIAPFSGQAQSKLGFENYHYVNRPGITGIVPMVHFETKNNWYGELRYNYEDAETLSLFAGKGLAGGHDLSFAITPMAGVSVGRFTGVSAAVNGELEWKNMFLSSETQYSMGTKKDMTDFFFSWSEMGFNLSPRLFAGVALQYTRTVDQRDVEPGILAGFNIKQFSFPFYAFRPFTPGGYFVLGVNYEYHLKKK